MKDEQGRWLTRALFFETALPVMRAKFDCPYTLKEDDYTDAAGNHYKSLRKIYLSLNDPTGYLLATEELGSWSRWNAISKAAFFKPHLKNWQEELEIKILATGFAGMIAEATGGGRSSATASKWLAEKGWDKENTKGRPSKRKIADEAKKLERIKEETDEFLRHANKLN